MAARDVMPSDLRARGADAVVADPRRDPARRRAAGRKDGQVTGWVLAYDAS